MTKADAVSPLVLPTVTELQAEVTPTDRTNHVQGAVSARDESINEAPTAEERSPIDRTPVRAGPDIGSMGEYRPQSYPIRREVTLGPGHPPQVVQLTRTDR